MPVNEFEKQVQQKMEELQLRPSPEVWTEVEKRIREKKKRRRIILFWWLFPVLLAGSGLIFYNYFNNHTDSIVSQQTTQPDPAQEVSPADKKPVKPEQSLPENSMTLSQIEAKTDEKGNTSVVKTGTISQPAAGELANRNTGLVKKPVKGVRAPKRNPVKQTGRVSNKLPVHDNGTGDLATEGTKKQKQALEPEKIIQPGKETITAPDVKQQVPVQPPVIATAVQPDTVMAEEEISNKTETAANITGKKEEHSKPKHKKNQRSWEWGVELKPGISNVYQGSLLGGPRALESLSASPNVGMGGPFAGAVVTGAPRVAFSGGAEVFAQKEISKKLKLQLGIHYSNLGSRVDVGNRVDSSRSITNDLSAGLQVGNFYQAPGGTSRNFSNRYHLAGVSAGISWKLLDKKSFSLFWENSLAASRLIAANALHYDNRLGVYYTDFTPYRKTQLFFNTGLSIPVLKQAKLGLSLHPFASYGLLPVLKKGSNRESHFINYGLGLRFLFPGK